MRLVRESAIHIFHLFQSLSDESEVNQSVVLEIHELLTLCKSPFHSPNFNSYALILIEDGVEIRSPLTGGLRSSSCSWQHEFFTDPSDTHRFVRKFCHNALRQIYAWEEG
jgi:hypothetical protein